jgi:hypothetical protein
LISAVYRGRETGYEEWMQELKLEVMLLLEVFGSLGCRQQKRLEN